MCDAKQVVLLLEADASPNVADAEGNTAMHTAVMLVLLARHVAYRLQGEEHACSVHHVVFLYTGVQSS